jgi:hypothetical protein
MTMPRRFLCEVDLDLEGTDVLAALVAATAETSVKPPETIHSLREIPAPHGFFPASDM